MTTLNTDLPENILLALREFEDTDCLDGLLDVLHSIHPDKIQKWVNDNYPHLAKYRCVLDGGEDYIYYKLGHKLIMSVFNSSGGNVVISSPYLSTPWISKSDPSVVYLRTIIEGLVMDLNNPVKISVPSSEFKKDQNSMNYLLSLIRCNSEGLSMSELISIGKEEGYTSYEIKDRMTKIIDAGCVYVTTNGKFKVA